MGAVSLNLLVDCISFHIPNTLLPSPPTSTGCRFPTSESRLALWPHSHESGSQTSRHWKSPLIRALTSSDGERLLRKHYNEIVTAYDIFLSTVFLLVIDIKASYRLFYTRNRALRFYHWEIDGFNFPCIKPFEPAVCYVPAKTSLRTAPETF